MLVLTNNHKDRVHYRRVSIHNQAMIKVCIFGITVFASLSLLLFGNAQVFMSCGVEISSQGHESILTMSRCASNVLVYLSNMSNWKQPIIHPIDNCPQLTFENLTASGKSIKYWFHWKLRTPGTSSLFEQQTTWSELNGTELVDILQLISVALMKYILWLNSGMWCTICSSLDRNVNKTWAFHLRSQYCDEAFS